jgi:amidase
MHYFPQSRVQHPRCDPSNGLHELYAGVQQAFPENTLPNHPGRSEKKYIHALNSGIIDQRGHLVKPTHRSLSRIGAVRRYTGIVPYRSSLCLMVSMVRDGAISPVELVDQHLRQIEARNPALNAFVTVMADRAREEAREREQAVRRGEPLGLLHGVPLTVKDSFDIAGQPTRAGSLLRTEQPAANDAAAVARLRSHGAIILGRTNTPELLAAYETDNFITGRTNNPWDLERTPGGSSGGEAAAIAAFCSPGGIGSDGGGSLRIPAHFCGIAALKPTPGRISGIGHTPSLGYPAGLLSVVGPMARTAQDLHLLFSALAGYDAQDPLSAPVPLRQPTPDSPRIGVWEQFYNVPVDPEIRAAIVHAAALLSGLGWAVEPFEPRGLERAPNVWAVLFGWPASATRKFVEGREDEVHWTLRESLGGAGPSADQVLLNLAARDRMRAALLRQMENTAALLMPVSCITAFRHRERKWQISDQTVGLFQAQEVGLFQAMMPAVLANVLGLPAVTVPMAISAAGLPIGVQLVGRPFEDELLLEIAVRLEQARGDFPIKME